MRITLLTAGSAGDVRPYAALGVGLQAAGHRVRLATYPPFEDLVARHGLEFFAFEGEIGRATEGTAKRRWQRSGGRPLPFVTSLVRMVDQARGVLRRSLDGAWEACQDSDAVIASAFAFGAPKIAQLLGVPFYWALLQPMTRTRAFPHFLAPPRLRLGGPYNELTYAVADRVYRRLVRGVLDDWRREMFGLGAVARGDLPLPGDPSHPVLYGFSPAVVPAPRDWNDAVHVTGFWHLDGESDWRPDPQLAAFLEAGDPPVWVYVEGDDDEGIGVAQRAVDALSAAGLRGLLFAPWDDLAGVSLPPTVLRVGFEPLDRLLPHVAAACHHYGVGTSSAALRAGVPSLGRARSFDQPFWARRLERLGVGLPPLPPRPSVGRLARAFERAAGDPQLRRRAKAFGERLRAEDGVARAVEAFALHLPAARRPARRAAGATA